MRSYQDSMFSSCLCGSPHSYSTVKIIIMVVKRARTAPKIYLLHVYHNNNNSFLMPLILFKPVWHHTLWHYILFSVSLDIFDLYCVHTWNNPSQFGLETQIPGYKKEIFTLTIPIFIYSKPTSIHNVCTSTLMIILHTQILVDRCYS